MNYFEYRIYDIVYDDIISGKKTIEFRLLNDKSKKIRIGDEINFKVLNDETKNVLVEVIGKNVYNNLDDLWNNKDILNNSLDYTKDEFEFIFYKIFGEDLVKKSKIVGIKFRLK